MEYPKSRGYVPHFRVMLPFSCLPSATQLGRAHLICHGRAAQQDVRGCLAGAKATKFEEYSKGVVEAGRVWQNVLSVVCLIPNVANTFRCCHVMSMLTLYPLCSSTTRNLTQGGTPMHQLSPNFQAQQICEICKSSCH